MVNYIYAIETQIFDALRLLYAGAPIEVSRYAGELGSREGIEILSERVAVASQVLVGAGPIIPEKNNSGVFDEGLEYNVSAATANIRDPRGEDAAKELYQILIDVRQCLVNQKFGVSGVVAEKYPSPGMIEPNVNRPGLIAFTAPFRFETKVNYI